MEEILSYRISWWNFLLSTAVLLLPYFVLRFSNRLWPGAVRGVGIKGRIREGVHYLLTLYEPFILLVIAGLFVLVNPVLHGAMVLVLFLAGFSHVRNYISGRIVRFDESMNPGVQLQSRDMQGIISRLGNLGLHLKTLDGLYYISYSKLLADGYTLLSGEEMGGFFRLQIKTWQEGEEASRAAAQLGDLLATTPYLDWNHPPEWIPAMEAGTPPEVRVLLREEQHLAELMQLMNEWGYGCEVVGVG